MDAGEPPRAAPPLDPSVADTQRQQLSPSDVPMLFRRDARDLYRGVISI
jgi:hypothetical protein